ncbi:MAG TPA: aminoglycoside phosphotransferase [Gammaproteobacteria bacterium]|nr:aminoglycoside phosphotransferase [Gammaproteobacteria bacterium]
MTNNDVRLKQLEDWLRQSGKKDYEIRPASDDASFRRYFRISHNNKSFIVMDAPPDKEDSRPFVGLARAFLKVGLNVPQVLEQDQEQGFLLLTDFGDRQYLDVLNDENVGRLYGDAMGALLVLQVCGDLHYPLPSYDEKCLMAEMKLFRDWLLVRHHGIELSRAEQDMLDNAFTFLCRSAVEQPQVPVHRDYHSRNLMVLESHNPGILDFQDAVTGPVTYDLVSLLRDCYIEWPRKQTEEWVTGYYDLAMQSGILREQTERQFIRWFDLMGVQRHLKAAGIFARLNYRDNKPGYMRDVPRTVGYIIDVSGRYPELEGLHRFITGKLDF